MTDMQEAPTPLPDRCPICAGERRELLWTWDHEPFLLRINVDRSQDVVVCLDCGMIYRSPPLERDLLARLHEELNLDLHSDEDLIDRVAWLRKRLSRWGTHLRVLEVGSGTGKMLEILREAGVEACGIEPNPEAAESIRARGFQVYEGYVENVSLPERSYDGVIFMHLLEHLDDPRGFLFSVRRLLDEGGVAYLEVPNALRVPLPFSPFFPSFHRTEFIPQTLTNLLACCGFEPVDIEAAYSIRVLAKVSECKCVDPPGPQVAREIQQSFSFNRSAKHLCESLMLLNTKPERVDHVLAMMKETPRYAEHLRWRLATVEDHLARWENTLRNSPAENWPNALHDAVETLRSDPQFVILLMKVGHSGLDLPGHLGRVTFRTLKVDDSEPVALASANRAGVALKWLMALIQAGDVLRNILRGLNGRIGME
ncbi:MAG: class I SAM-dependent methyltransferase [bacterium]